MSGCPRPCSLPPRCPPSPSWPLVVRVCEPGYKAPEQRVQRALQKHFQSGHRSGGGDCEVRAGPCPGTFLLCFTKPQDKEGVLRHGDHTVQIGAEQVKLVLEACPEEALKERGPAGAEPEACPEAAGSPGDEPFVKVSAQLSTSLLSERQREEAAARCARLSLRRGPRGIEAVDGDLEDVAELRRLLKQQLSRKDEGRESSLELSSRDHGSGPSSVDGGGPSPPIVVPLSLYDYFSHVFAATLKDLCRQYRVAVRMEADPQGSATVRFVPDGPPATVAAGEAFAEAFKQATLDLAYKQLPAALAPRPDEAARALGRRFPGLLIRAEGGRVGLLGPPWEVEAALEEAAGVKVQLHGPPATVTLSAAESRLLTELQPHVRAIETKFSVRVWPTPVPEPTLLLFEPRRPGPDLSAHARAAFVDAFQGLSSRPQQRASLAAPEGPPEPGRVSGNFQKPPPDPDPGPGRGMTALWGLPAILQDATQRLGHYLSPMEDRAGGEARGGLQEEEEEDVCPICLDSIRDKKTLEKCRHSFCSPCIQRALEQKPVCPICQQSYGKETGNQPPGTMSTRVLPTSLPGHPGCGTIEITYDIAAGRQAANHPCPGQPFQRTCRVAYLPNDAEGQAVLRLLRVAFDRKLIFTIGQSRTTGARNVITWNDIHHKTSQNGGPSRFGYPDPSYLGRVREELKAKGIE
ncbi:E3 ubiquitin-protein ligase DTX3L [Tachyglossus aculeatus]|uniref:E3 ubiquitin-protein ligase DTX3L n=1 Tax=Tachyglossus aculeatus TaxID=9261 RepID=UPI0018F79626|nr:E3 ubiquitin-protein ligase DTX3L [Tachyglossus aculeatus]